MEENKPICQSCGMPMLDKDFGSNTDGSKSLEYCLYCYEKGEFVDGCRTAEEKIAKNIDIAIAMGMAEDEAKSLAENTIPYLSRWK